METPGLRRCRREALSPSITRAPAAVRQTHCARSCSMKLLMHDVDVANANAASARDQTRACAHAPPRARDIDIDHDHDHHISSSSSRAPRARLTGSLEPHAAGPGRRCAARARARRAHESCSINRRRYGVHALSLVASRHARGRGALDHVHDHELTTAERYTAHARPTTLTARGCSSGGTNAKLTHCTAGHTT